MDRKFVLKGRDGCWVSLGSDEPAWGKCSEGLRWGDRVTYPLHWDVLRVKRHAADNFRGVNSSHPGLSGANRAMWLPWLRAVWASPGHRRRFHQVWGRRQSTQKLFQKCAGEVRGIDFFPWMLLSVRLVVLLEQKWDVVGKAGGLSIRPAFFYFLLSVWLLGMLFPQSNFLICKMMTICFPAMWGLHEIRDPKHPGPSRYSVSASAFYFHSFRY